jgi:hypothetical protein
VLHTGPTTPLRLTWDDGNREDGYVVLRWSPNQGFIIAPDGYPLSATTASYTDPSSLTEFVYCYQVRALGPTLDPTNPLAISDFLCLLPAYTAAPAAEMEVSVELDQSQTATLHWIPAGGANAFVLYTINLDTNATSTLPAGGVEAHTTHDTSGHTFCYLVFGFRGEDLTASTKAVCVAPGNSSGLGGH